VLQVRLSARPAVAPYHLSKGLNCTWLEGRASSRRDTYTTGIAPYNSTTRASWRQCRDAPVATRIEAHFKKAGVKVNNPFAG
jgi:hypothetical protein